MALREDLELNIADALADVDRVGRELTQVAKAWKVELAKAFDTLDRDVQVTVTADVRQVTGAVEGAVDAADTSVSVTADSQEITGSVEGAVDAADTSVTVTADATPVTGAIDGAVNAADTTVTVSADSAQAEQQFSVLGGKLKTIAGIVGFTLIADQLRDATMAASDLNESLTKTDAVFKENQDTVLAWSETSAESVLLSQQAALEAASTFGNLFTALGSTTEEAAALSPQVVQLAADFASFNNIPVEDALLALRSGLVGEIEPLRRLGVSFNAAQVEAKALELGLAATKDEITEADKVTTRWNLILEQSANAQGDVARTSEGLANQIRLLQAEFADTQASVGRALLPAFQSLVDLARQLLPTFESFASVSGTAFSAIVPVVTQVVEALQPLVDTLLVALQDAFVDLTPALGAIGDAFVAIIDASGPVIDFIALLVEAFGTGLAGVLQIVAPILEDFAPQIVALATAFGVLRLALLALNVNPLLAVATAATLLSGLLVNLAESSTAAARAGADLRESVFGDAATVRDTAQAWAEYRDTLATSIATTGAFSTGAIQQQLSDAGITLDQVSSALLGNADAFKQVQAGFVDTGDTVVTAGKNLEGFAEGTELTAEQVRQLDGDFVELARTGQIVVTGGGDLADAWAVASNEAENLALSQLRLLQASGEVTQAQIDEATARAEAADGYANYRDILSEVVGIQEEEAAAQAKAAEAVSAQTSSWIDLADSVLAGTTTLEDAQTVADTFGITLEQAEGYIGAFTDAVDNFVSQAVSKLPSASDALRDVGDAADPAKLLENLKKQTDAIVGFNFIVLTLAQEGFDDLAQFLIDQGPVVGGQWAAAIATGDPAIKQALEDQIQLHEDALVQSGQVYTLLGPTLVADEAIALAQQTTDGFGLNLDMSGEARDSLDDASAELNPDVGGSAANRMEQNARWAGESAGTSFGEGFKAGLIAEQASIVQQASDIADLVLATWTVLFAFGSPSKVTEEMGVNLGLGFIEGLESVQSQFDATAASFLTGLPAAGGQAAGSATTVNVAVNVAAGASMTQGDAQTVGVEVASAVRSALRSIVRSA